MPYSLVRRRVRRYWSRGSVPPRNSKVTNADFLPFLTFSEFLKDRGRYSAYGPDDECDPVGRWCWTVSSRAQPEVIDLALYEYMTRILRPRPLGPPATTSPEKNEEVK